MEEKQDWISCPPEIYTDIFRKLAAKDIISCLFVNRLWRRIIEGDVSMDWQRIAEQGLCDGGIEMKTRFQLDWRDVVIKSAEWLHGMPFVKVKNIHSYNGQGDYFPVLTAYKDKIYVHSKNYAECISVKDCSRTVCTRLEKCDMHFVDESDHIRVLSDGKLKLRLVGKNSFDDDEPPKPESMVEFESEHQLLYLLHQDRCYIFSKKQCLRSFVWRNQQWEPKFIARFYGTQKFVSMVAQGEEVFFMAKHGDLWMASEAERAFKKIASFAMPDFYHPANSYAVLKTILSVSPKDNYNSISKEVCSLFQKGVTCATFHAGVLLLAFSDGHVQAFVLETKTSSDLDYFQYDSDIYDKLDAGCSFSTENQDDKYFRLLSLRLGRMPQAELRRIRYDVCRLHDFVYGMAVCEGGSSRYLFVNCGHTIYQYQLTYPGFS